MITCLSDFLPDSLTLKGSAQGLALHRNHAFMLRHGGQCLILDLRNHRTVAAFQLDSNNTHCNNASFSRYRLYGDPYPLLYVSSCFGSKACLVTRFSSGASSVIQRITFRSEAYPVAQDWCLDPDSNYLYAYGGRKGGPMSLKKFHLPLPTIGDVTLTEDDVLQTIPVNCVNVAQGSKIKNGYAYLPEGDRPGHYCRRHLF